MGRDREKVYVTLKDENGATYTRYEQYLFTPYNKQGKIEELQKGNTIDLKAQRSLVQWIECHASNLEMWVRFLQDRPFCPGDGTVYVSDSKSEF